MGTVRIDIPQLCRRPSILGVGGTADSTPTGTLREPVCAADASNIDRRSAFCARAAASHGSVDGVAAAAAGAPGKQARAGCGATRAAFCARSNAKSGSAPSFAMAKHGSVKGLAMIILSVCKNNRGR